MAHNPLRISNSSAAMAFSHYDPSSTYGMCAFAAMEEEDDETPGEVTLIQGARSNVGMEPEKLQSCSYRE